MPGPQAQNGSPPGEGDAPALEFAGLYKHFGPNVAVDHIDLRVPRGSFFGLVGPNGAGKTTSLSMAVGLLRPDGGTVRIFGRDVWSDPVAAKALIGVLPDGLALPDRLTGREVLTYLGLLRGMPRAVVGQRADELLRVLELDSADGTVVADYSIRVILQRFVAGGGSVIFASHVMDLVERLCDHVAVLTKGRVEAAGPVAEMSAGRSLEDAFVHIVGARPGGTEGLSWLAS
jgi:ABC-2 type transport system ATP-binding protein